MNNTAINQVPVRFQFMPGGTSPAAVVDLLNALTDLVLPFLNEEELSRRNAESSSLLSEGVSVRGGELESSTADSTAQGTQDEGTQDDAQGETEKDPEQVAQEHRENDTQEDKQGDTDLEKPEEEPATPQKVRNILVPVEPGTNIPMARAQLINRLAGPLPARTALVMQTSGSTTAQGHLVALSISALLASARSTAAALGPQGRWILALPAHHISGLQILTRSILSNHRPVIVDTTRGFKPAALSRAVQRATKDPNVPAYLSLVPTQLSAILDEGGDCAKSLTRLHAVLVGGAATTPYLLDRARTAGIRVITTYGMTETCGGCVYDGIPLAGMQVSTVNEHVWLSGTFLMEGYLDEITDPNEEPFVQLGARRWMRTKDNGRLEGARLVIQGRSDDVINTGGVKVHATAVEAASAQVSGVDQVSVVGLPDARWGEVVTAVVVPASGVEENLLSPMLGAATLGLMPDEETDPGIEQNASGNWGMGGLVEPDSLAARIRTAVTAELGSAHAPRVIVVVPYLPLLGPGKVDRREVADIARRELRSGRAWVR